MTPAGGRLALASRALFDELERDLRPFALVRGGSLVVFEDGAEEAYARDHCARLGHLLLHDGGGQMGHHHHQQHPRRRRHHPNTGGAADRSQQR